MKRKRSGKARVALSLLLLLCVWTVWGNTALRVNFLRISSDRLPAAFSGFRIAQVSDLHNAEFGKGNVRLLKALSENAPDIIVITGDFVDSRRTAIDIAVHFAEQAVQIAPVYYVTGNHEARLPQYAALRAGLEAAGEPAPEEEADGTSPLAQPASRRADRANTRHFLIAHSTSPAAESVTGT